MCIAHGEEQTTVNILTGSVGCRRCAAIRARVSRLRHANRKTPGRNPREQLLRIPNAQLRERYQELVNSGQATATEIALAAGYTKRRPSGAVQADIQRLKKQLGVIEQVGKTDPVTGERPLYRTESVAYDTAVLLCPALGIEYPAEVGV